MLLRELGESQADAKHHGMSWLLAFRAVVRYRRSRSHRGRQTVVIACNKCGQKNRLNAADVLRPTRCGACKTALTPIAEPIDADGELFDEVVQHAPVSILVDFWAAWCGPCRAAAPEVRRAATIMAGRALVLKVDTEQHPDIAARYHVQGIPNFIVLKNGRVVIQQAGVVPSSQLVKWIESADRAA